MKGDFGHPVSSFCKTHMTKIDCWKHMTEWYIVSYDTKLYSCVSINIYLTAHVIWYNIVLYDAIQYCVKPHYNKQFSYTGNMIKVVS